MAGHSDWLIIRSMCLQSSRLTFQLTSPVALKFLLETINYISDTSVMANVSNSACFYSISSGPPVLRNYVQNLLAKMEFLVVHG